MALDLADYETKAREAIQAFWGNRSLARQKQLEAGTADRGERSGVTAGKNMDGFAALAIDLVRANGLSHADIYRRRSSLALPGFFRPTKVWDLLVLEQLYTSASVIASPRSAVTTGAFVDLSAMTGLRTFVTSLAGHIAAEAARTGVS